MFRFIGAFLALLSSLLCVGVIVLGIRSRHQSDLLAIKTPWGHASGIAGDHGGLLMAMSDISYDGEVATDGQLRSVAYMCLSSDQFQPYHDTLFDPTALKFSFLGFKTAAGSTVLTTQISPHFSAVLIPCWFLAIVFAVLPLRIFRGMWTRHRRVRKGLCLACGYDIRASTGRCPECGKGIPTPGKSAGATATT